MRKKQEKQLNDILDVLNQFAIGRYDYRNLSYQEGVNSKIHNRLEKLGESIVFHHQNLLAEKEATKSLITDISHQLKTPLAGLKTSQYILQEEELTEQERREFVDLMGRQIAHLENLTSALVNVSRMETGLIAIQPENADILQTIKEAVESIHSKAEGSGIIVDDSETLSFMLDHDPKWTREALANILDNAVKYSPAGSRIRIRTEPGNFFFRIEISDEGIGVPVEECSRIFTRFYRGKGAAVKETEGSGVGLYLARKIVEEQQGNITVKNGRNGMGTIFIVQLPLP